MTRLNSTAAREQLPKILNRAASRKRRTIIARRGKDMAAVIPIEDLRLLERLEQEEEDRLDLELAREALKEIEEKGTIPWDEAKQRWGL
jgi:prevent-host-death family protein